MSKVFNIVIFIFSLMLYFVAIPIQANAGCCEVTGGGGNTWCYDGMDSNECERRSGTFTSGGCDCDFIVIHDDNDNGIDPNIDPNNGDLYNCCSYIGADNKLFCDYSAGSYPKEECKSMAKAAGAKKYKWGNFITDNPSQVCCDRVSEYLKVTLDDLSVSTLGSQLIMNWDTATEINNLGMNLWCAQMNGTQFEEVTRLNSKLIPSKAILPNYGASYSSKDYSYVNTYLKSGIQYCTIEDVDAFGQCTLHCDQIDTAIIDDNNNNVSNAKLNELKAEAIALCNEHKQDGICLDQLLAPK